MKTNRLIWIATVLVAFGLGTGAGVMGILWATGGNATPSQDADERVERLSLDDPAPTPNALGVTGTQIAALNSDIESISKQVDTLSQDSASISNRLDAIATVIAGGVAVGDADGLRFAGAPAVDDETPSEASAAQPTPEPQSDTTAANVPERAIYSIADVEGTEARFKIDETLSGSPVTVVGTSPDVAGDIDVNFSNPPASRVGPIAINARLFKTDIGFRDQAIRGQILQSSQDQYEFIDFVTNELLSLQSEPVGVGETLTFQITGDLTVRGATREATFDVEVTVVSADEIRGFAKTEIMYADYGITINAPPTVSAIGDVVTLELDFVASKQNPET